MLVLALTSTQRGLWWGAVIGGFVVVLAVAALLTILVLLVRTIDRRVLAIRDTLGRHVESRVQAVIAKKHHGELPIGAAEIIATDNDRWPWLICAPTIRIV